MYSCSISVIDRNDFNRKVNDFWLFSVSLFHPRPYRAAAMLADAIKLGVYAENENSKIFQKFLFILKSIFLLTVTLVINRSILKVNNLEKIETRVSKEMIKVVTNLATLLYVKLPVF